MEIALVVAVTRVLSLPGVEKSLRRLGVRGITVSRVRGWGEYSNTFGEDAKLDEVRVDIFVERERADAVAHAIIEACHTGSPGDGIVAILPVDKVYSARTRGEVVPNRPRTQGEPAAP